MILWSALLKNLAHWEHYHTGTLETVGVTEGQSIVGLYAILSGCAFFNEGFLAADSAPLAPQYLPWLAEYLPSGNKEVMILAKNVIPSSLCVGIFIRVYRWYQSFRNSGQVMQIVLERHVEEKGHPVYTLIPFFML